MQRSAALLLAGIMLVPAGVLAQSPGPSVDPTSVEQHLCLDVIGPPVTDLVTLAQGIVAGTISAVLEPCGGSLEPGASPSASTAPSASGVPEPTPTPKPAATYKYSLKVPGSACFNANYRQKKGGHRYGGVVIDVRLAIKASKGTPAGPVWVYLDPNEDLGAHVLRLKPHLKKGEVALTPSDVDDYTWTGPTPKSGKTVYVASFFVETPFDVDLSVDAGLGDDPEQALSGDAHQSWAKFVTSSIC